MSGNAFDQRLVRLRKMPKPVRVVYARPRAFVAMALGIVAFLLMPTALRLVTRMLIGWDAFVVLYVTLVYIMMLRSHHRLIRRNAVLQDDGRFLIPLFTAVGAFASIAAIVFELGASHRGLPQLGLATLTIALSWAAVHTPSRCTTPTTIIAAPSQAACNFRAAMSTTAPTTGTSSISLS